MKASEFLKDKRVTYIEYIDNRIINVVIGNEVFGLKVDTSGIPAGTPLTRSADFSIENDILTVSTLSLDLTTVKMLGFGEIEE